MRGALASLGLCLSVGVLTAGVTHPKLAWRLTPTAPAVLVTTTALPDGRAALSGGAGFSATGLARYAGSLVIGNDGRRRDPDPEAGSTPGLVFLGADGAAREIALPAGASVQGVVVDPADGLIWTASPSLNLIRKLGPATGAVLFTAAFKEPNGLAIGPEGELLVLDRARDVYALEPRGARRFLFHAVHGDGLYHEAGAGLVWTADNGEARAFDLRRRRLKCRVTLPGINYAEGLVVERGQLWVVHNGAFHRTSSPAAAPPRSLIARYTLEPDLKRRCYGRALLYGWPLSSRDTRS